MTSTYLVIYFICEVDEGLAYVTANGQWGTGNKQNLPLSRVAGLFKIQPALSIYYILYSNLLLNP